MESKSCCFFLFVFFVAHLKVSPFYPSTRSQVKAKSASRSGSRGSRGANGAMSPERELPKNHGLE